MIGITLILKEPAVWWERQGERDKYRENYSQRYMLYKLCPGCCESTEVEYLTWP